MVSGEKVSLLMEFLVRFLLIKLNKNTSDLTHHKIQSIHYLALVLKKKKLSVSVFHVFLNLLSYQLLTVFLTYHFENHIAVVL